MLSLNVPLGKCCRREILQVECDNHLCVAFNSGGCHMSIIRLVRHQIDKLFVSNNTSLWKMRADLVKQVGALVSSAHLLLDSSLPLARSGRSISEYIVEESLLGGAKYPGAN